MSGNQYADTNYSGSGYILEEKYHLKVNSRELVFELVRHIQGKNSIESSISVVTKGRESPDLLEFNIKDQGTVRRDAAACTTFPITAF